MKDSRNIAEMRIAPVYVYYRGSTASYVTKPMLKGMKVGGGGGLWHHGLHAAML